jgi:hydroxyacylglutathione hydrolase
LANLRFALAVEPGNVALQERLRRDQDKRERGMPTVPSTVADERATNPFLRTTVPEVVAAAEAWSGHPLSDGVAVFAALREWKNGFR